MMNRDQTTQAERFAAAVLLPMLDGDGLSNLDGFDIEKIAIEAGLLVQIEVTEPCRGEGCRCAAEAGFPTRCNQLTMAGEALRRAR